MDLTWLPFFLQTNDALFPTGAYAHSLGFEELVRLEVIRHEASLREFLFQQVLPAQEHHELPYLRFAWEAATRGDLDALCALDREIAAWKLAAETRAASVQIGRRRLKALGVISDAPIVAELESRITRGDAAGHHLIVWAVQAAAGGIPLEPTLAAWLYQALAAIAGAALKLVRIGQDACQRAVRAAAAESPKAITASLQIERGEAGWFNPLLEIASMRHARASERLFIS
jgi:urease accessory protein